MIYNFEETQADGMSSIQPAAGEVYSENLFTWLASVSVFTLYLEITLMFLGTGTIELHGILLSISGLKHNHQICVNCKL